MLSRKKLRWEFLNEKGNSMYSNNLGMDQSLFHLTKYCQHLHYAGFDGRASCHTREPLSQTNHICTPLPVHHHQYCQSTCLICVMGYFCSCQATTGNNIYRSYKYRKGLVYQLHQYSKNGSTKERIVPPK